MIDAEQILLLSNPILTSWSILDDIKIKDIGPIQVPGSDVTSIHVMHKLFKAIFNGTFLDFLAAKRITKSKKSQILKLNQIWNFEPKFIMNCYGFSHIKATIMCCISLESY